MRQSLYVAILSQPPKHWGSRCVLTTGKKKLRSAWGRSAGTHWPEVVCASLTQEPLVRFFFFFFWETLIVVECSTAYSKYHSYKLLASTFQSDHYLIFKTKQNPKESKTTKPDLHFIHTSVATGLSKLYAPGCVLKTPINYLIKLLGRHRSKVYYYNYYFSMFLFVFKM